MDRMERREEWRSLEKFWTNTRIFNQLPLFRPEGKTWRSPSPFLVVSSKRKKKCDLCKFKPAS